MRICKACGDSKEFIFLKINEKKRGLKIYVDQNGSRWCGATCPQCRNYRDIARSRRNGVSVSIDDVKAPHLALGRRSERRAAEMLAKMGMTDIKLTTVHGPDITFKECGIVKTCEVKTVLKSFNGASWFTTPVKLKREGDDYFAAVFPNGDVSIENMALHLKKASRCGQRTFTKEWLFL